MKTNKHLKGILRKRKMYEMITHFANGNKIHYSGESSAKTLYIGSEDAHKVRFKLKWVSDDHYTVYLDLKNELGKDSPAIGALWNTSDVVLFLNAVLNLKKIYAMKDNPNEED